MTVPTSVDVQPTSGPLAGLRIIDLTTAWAGPMAGRALASLGADVIHVEGPSRIDSWRGPVRGGDRRRYPDEEFGERPYNRSCMFNTQNQGKRAICVDLSRPEGIAIVKRLVRVSDALVANFTPGALDRLGLDAETLKRENPDLVVMEMPGFGGSGPASTQVALGPSMEAAAGMAYFIGYGDGRPYVTGPAYMDPIGAFNGAAALLTAIIARRSGQDAHHVELAQCEAGMHWIGELLLSGIASGSHQPSAANASSSAEPHGAYRCAGDDEWVAIAIRNDAEWARLRDLIAEQITVDGAYDDMIVRRRRRESIGELISSWTAGRSKGDVAESLQAIGLLAAPVSSGADVAQRPDLWNSGFFTHRDHLEAGSHWYQGMPFRFGEKLMQAERPAPLLGEHNADVIKQLLGFSDVDYQRLVEDQIIATEPKTNVEPISPARQAEAS